MTHTITSDATPVYGDPYEVRRNRAYNPVPASLSGLVAVRSTLELADGGAKMVSTDASARINVFLNNRPSVTEGETLRFSAEGKSGTGTGLIIAILFYASTGAYIPGSIVSSTEVTGTASFQTVLVDAVVPAGAATATFYAQLTGSAPIGSEGVFRHFYAGTPGSYFDGATTNDPELTPSWTGTPNASESILSFTPVLIPSVTNPLAVAGYATKRESRNVVSDTLDGGIGVAHFAPRLRKATLTTVYTTAEEAWKAYAMYGRGQHFTLYPDDAPAAQMRFVLDGDLRIAQDADDPAIWFVDIDYQEVSA